MDQWVRILTAQFGRPVIDKTGLTGKYDFVLKYKGRWDRDRNADDMDPTPPMDRALQEQLGLKVEANEGASKGCWSSITSKSRRTTSGGRTFRNVAFSATQSSGTRVRERRSLCRSFRLEGDDFI